MSKIDKIGHYNIETGEPIDKEMYKAIEREHRNQIYNRLNRKFNNKTITKAELIQLMKMKKKPINIEVLYDAFYKVNMCKPKPKSVTDSEYGKFFQMLNFLSYNNSISYSNGKVIKAERISEFLGFNVVKSFKNYIRKLQKNRMLAEMVLGGVDYLIINPIYAMHEDFEWYLDIFNIFSDSLRQELSEVEYLRIKSKWYDVSHEMLIDNYEELPKNMSGIYRLYKNGNIVYIGKSICIKSRLWAHIKEKDIDGFDFSILNNESDKNIYELYYIDKYKPVYNKDCLEASSSNIKLKDLDFGHVIKIKDNNIEECSQAVF